MTKKSLFISLSIAVVLLVAMLLCSFMINNNMAYADYQDILNDGSALVNFNQLINSDYVNSYVYNVSNAPQQFVYCNNSNLMRSGNKLYFSFNVSFANSTYVFAFNGANVNTYTFYANTTGLNEFILTLNDNYDNFYIYVTSSANGLIIKNFKVINLTAMFGANNDNLTLAQCQELFVSDYYPYNTGTPVSLSGFNEYSKGVSDTYSNLQLNITNYSAFSSAYIVSELSSSFPETFIERHIDYEVLLVPFMKARGVLGVPLNDIAPAGSLIKFTYIDPSQGGSGNYLWCGIQYGNQFVPVMYIGSDDVPTDENGYISFACPFDTQTLCFCESSSSTQFIMETSAFWLGELQVVNAKMGDIQNIIDSAISGAIYERDDYWSYYYRFGDGYQQIYNSGYTAGINADADDFGSRYYTFTQFLGALFDVPVRVIVSLLDFDFLGFNLKNFAFSMITLAIVFAIIRLILQKTGDKE